MCKDLIFKYTLPAVLAASLCLINGRSNAADENNVPGGLRPKIQGSVQYRRSYVYGKWIFDYEYRGNVKDFTPYEYENWSNSQKILKRTDSTIYMRCEARVEGFSSAVSFPAGDTYLKHKTDPSVQGGAVHKPDYFGYYLDTSDISPESIQYITEKALDITRNAKTQQEAVELIMEYVRANVDYSLSGSRDPASVLRYGKAYCVGYANAAIYLVRSLGIPAKNISCWMPPGHDWGSGNSGGNHAYLDVYYNDKGWVSYDPQHSVHFVDPYHLVNSRQINPGISFVQGKSYCNMVDIARDDPIYRVLYSDFKIGVSPDLVKSSNKIILGCRLKDFPAGIICKLLYRDDNGYNIYEASSVDERFNDEFYMVLTGRAINLFLEISGNGQYLLQPLAIPVSGNTCDIAVDRKHCVRLAVTRDGKPAGRQKLEVYTNGLVPLVNPAFYSIGETDVNGEMLTNVLVKGGNIIRVISGSRAETFAAADDGSGRMTISLSLSPEEYIKNFIEVNTMLKAGYACIGRITLPDGTHPSSGSVSFIPVRGEAVRATINAQGIFYVAGDPYAAAIERILYSSGPYFSSLEIKPDNAGNRYLVSDMDFTMNAKQVFTGERKLVVFSRSGEGYVYSELVPDRNKKVYLADSDNRIYAGTCADGSDISLINLDQSTGVTYKPEDDVKKIVSDYKTFASHIKRISSFSVIGYVKDEKGNAVKDCEVILKKGKSSRRIIPGKNGVFVIYDKPERDGCFVIILRDGLYFKSGRIAKPGHSEIVVSLASRDAVNIRLKKESKADGIYVFSNNEYDGFVRFDDEGVVRIIGDGEFIVSKSNDLKSGVKVSARSGKRNIFL